MRVLFALLALAVTVSAQGWSGPNFYITGAKSDSSSYIFSINNTDVEDPPLTLTVGTTYKFIMNASLTIHALGFTLDNSATIAFANLSDPSLGSVTTSGSCTVGSKPFSWYTSDATNPCILTLTPVANSIGTPLYYRCVNHGGMIGTLTAVAAGGSGTTTGSGTGTGTGTPSGTGTGTGTPSGTGTPGTGTGTTPSGTVPGTGTGGKNDAAVIVPGAAALIIAAINALFSA